MSYMQSQVSQTSHLEYAVNVRKWHLIAALTHSFVQFKIGIGFAGFNYFGLATPIYFILSNNGVGKPNI